MKPIYIAVLAIELHLTYDYNVVTVLEHDININFNHLLWKPITAI